MKRRTFISAAGAAAAVGGLAACGSGTPGQSKEDPQSAGRAQVEFWGSVFTTPENDWYQKVVDDFNAAQEDVFVNYQVVPGDAWDQKLKAAQAAGNAPDMYVQPGRLDTAARTGLLLPLDDLFDASALDGATDAAKEVCQYQGQFYGFPLLVEPQMMLYWNKELFEKAGLDPEAPPASWDETYEACEALASVMGNGEFALNTAVDSGTFGWTTVAAQMHVAGHLPISDDWSTADAEDPAYEELITFYKTLQDNKWIPRQPLGAGNSAQALGEGKVAMMSQGSWGMSEIAADYPDMVEKIGMAPWVQSDGDQTTSVSTIGNMKWVIDAKAKEPEGTAAFFEWVLTDAEVLKPFFVDTQFTKAPARDEVTEVVNSDPAAEDAPWSDVVFEDVVPYCIPEAQYPWDVNLAMGNAIQAGMLGEKSPADALAEAQKEIQKVIDRENLAEIRAEMDA
ncbi:extracellular solute-binding protein [Brachybacterium sp. p3-SID957]|uniref:extracellular solute-binding protein n=1 Tax=Brachybacterium sp. p3-SID957 TaxID=2916049 RepID=UPI00223A769D|nr:extracellular solute-binding protein [Brachybacterium sp. p3-SID957]MCT1774699.1 extracellular solute-binding protein [Brachybacterium sp. p3-SID957]